jgi:hypothetical protein
MTGAARSERFLERPANPVEISGGSGKSGNFECFQITSRVDSH